MLMEALGPPLAGAYLAVRRSEVAAYGAQDEAFELAMPPPVQGQDIRITGYGTTGAGVPREWNQIQKTHAGPYFSITGTRLQYQTDTTGGNSGSPVIDDSTGLAIGVHTHGGCSQNQGNSGTGLNHAGFQNFLANPRGVCDVPCDECIADWNGDGSVDSADFADYLNDRSSGDARADLNDDGLVNTEVSVMIVGLWAAGC